MSNRSGKREGAGRKRKAIRPVDQNVAQRIKEKIQAEKLWVFAAQKAVEKARNTGDTRDLVRILMALDDRDLGRPVQEVRVANPPDEPFRVDADRAVDKLIAALTG